MRLKNHVFFKLIFFVTAITNISFCANKSSLNKGSPVANKTYYFSASGNDNSDGSVMKPFKTINKLNHLHLQAGNAVYFHGGDTFQW